MVHIMKVVDSSKKNVKVCICPECGRLKGFNLKNGKSEIYVKGNQDVKHVSKVAWPRVGEK